MGFSRETRLAPISRGRSFARRHGNENLEIRQGQVRRAKEADPVHSHEKLLTLAPSLLVMPHLTVIRPIEFS
jgi:hypothetical protein